MYIYTILMKGEPAMYNLLYYELRKLLGRPFVLVGMLILILVNVSCFCTQSLPSIVAREKEDSAYASGFQAVEIEQRLAQKYGETLTDECRTANAARLSAFRRIHGKDQRRTYSLHLQQFSATGGAVSLCQRRWQLEWLKRRTGLWL